MNIITRTLQFFGTAFKRSVSNLKNPAPWLLSAWGVNSKTGVAVTYDSVMTLSAVYRAFWVLASSMGSLPLNVYEKSGDITTLSTNHPINILLNKKPHPLYNPFVFKQTIMMHLLLQGNCYLLKKTNQYNEPISLYILPLREVDVFFDKVNHVKTFKYDGKTYDDTQVIHFIGLGFDGLVGKSPITLARENYAGSLAAQKYGNQVFENGVFSSGVVSVPGVMTDVQFDRLKQSVNESYAGVQNAGKPMILEGGGAFTPLKLDVQDAMFIESRKMTVLDVSRWTGVPPHILYELSKATFNNIESLGIEFVTYTLRNWCEMWESTLNTDLLTNADFGKNELRFNLDAMLRGDSKARSEYFKNMFYAGAFSPNDILKLEGYNAYEGGDDKYVPLNMMPTDLVRDYFMKDKTTTTNGN